MEQRSEEWYAARLGKVTASRVSDVMAKIKTGEAAARKNYRMELLCERLTSRQADNFVSGPMQRGIDLEPMARGMYEGINGVLVIETGFVDHPDIDWFGASPDGLVVDDGLMEIKCPNTATHIEFIRTGIIDHKYQLQMLVQMMCTGRKWCDFVSFDDRLPEQLQYRCARVHRDFKKEIDVITEVKAFLNDLAEIEVEMLTEMEKAA